MNVDTMSKRISHSSLIEAGFEHVWNGAKNIYELEADGKPTLRIGEYRDRNESAAYWAVYNAEELEDLKATDWDRLAKIVKQEFNIEI